VRRKLVLFSIVSIVHTYALTTASAEERLIISVGSGGTICSGPDAERTTKLSSFEETQGRTIDAALLDPTKVGKLPCDHPIWSGPTEPRSSLVISNTGREPRDVMVMLKPTARPVGEYRPFIQRLAAGGKLHIEGIARDRTASIYVAPPGSSRTREYTVSFTADGARARSPAQLSCEDACTLAVQ